MKDYIVRATAANAQIRAFAASTTELVEEARTRHNTSPVATAALGRLLTAGAMMGSMMKNPTDVLTLQVQCGGPIGGMTVTADSKGEVKGYVHNPDVMLPPKNGKLDVGGALGPGFLNVIKDMGLKEPYSGQTILQTGENWDPQVVKAFKEKFMDACDGHSSSRIVDETLGNETLHPRTPA